MRLIHNHDVPSPASHPPKTLERISVPTRDGGEHLHAATIRDSCELERQRGGSSRRKAGHRCSSACECCGVGGGRVMGDANIYNRGDSHANLSHHQVRHNVCARTYKPRASGQCHQPGPALPAASPAPPLPTHTPPPPTPPPPRPPRSNGADGWEPGVGGVAEGGPKVCARGCVRVCWAGWAGAPPFVVHRQALPHTHVLENCERRLAGGRGDSRKALRRGGVSGWTSIQPPTRHSHGRVLGGSRPAVKGTPSPRRDESPIGATHLQPNHRSRLLPPESPSPQDGPASRDAAPGGGRFGRRRRCTPPLAWRSDAPRRPQPRPRGSFRRRRLPEADLLPGRLPPSPHPPPKGTHPPPFASSTSCVRKHLLESDCHKFPKQRGPPTILLAARRIISSCPVEILASVIAAIKCTALSLRLCN
ncbi:ESX-1 secretion-associated protein EspI-like [Ischnura elegans]|uniref:ESX-1 secretion-associated protein EspI-like n=1 Tax=Ischnura elegans TaxID=197161 RepID=UPI001ED8B96D|nr:ESX-1 secretion-associated protein EspI-like [Ischnura elegans]